MISEMHPFPDGRVRKRRRLIEFSARDLDDASRLLSILAESAAPADEIRGVPERPNKDELIALASKMFDARKRRKRIFNPDLFGEAAWDFLLILYVMDERGPRLTIGRLRELAGVPSATTARWLAALEAQHLTLRETHRTDARTFYVQLTDKGRELMEMFLSETLAS